MIIISPPVTGTYLRLSRMMTGVLCPASYADVASWHDACGCAAAVAGVYEASDMTYVPLIFSF